MDALARYFFRSEAQLALIRKRGVEFQDHFNDLMSARYGSDFIRVRPAGSVGDRKCDGYRVSNKNVFQAYGPKAMESARTLTKVQEDFAGAVEQWTLSRWTFVHNDEDGLPPDVAAEIIRLNSTHHTIDVEQWTPWELRDLSDGLGYDHLVRIFGYPPTQENLQELTFDDISVAVRSLAQRLGSSHSPISRALPVNAEKLDYNSFSDVVRRLIIAGLAAAGTVEDFFDTRPDPTLRDRIANTMHSEWSARRVEVESGDEMFHILLEKLTEQTAGSRETTAALALMSFLFESCDIFDVPPTSWPVES